MSQYVFSVFIACLIFGAMRLLSYGNSVERFAIGAITLSVILTPLSGIISDFDVENWLDSIRTEQGDVDDGYGEALETAFADGVCRAVAEEFSLDREDIRVKLFGFSPSEMSADRVAVSLSGRAALADYRAVEKYLNRLGIGECDVSVEIK